MIRTLVAVALAATLLSSLVIIGTVTGSGVAPDPAVAQLAERHVRPIGLVGVVGSSPTAGANSATPQPAATPPIGDVGPVSWGDPAPTPVVVHAPSGFGRTYLRVPATQAARDWAWHRLGNREWACLDAIGHFESGWRVGAGSPDGSYGLAQASPGSKYASEGADWLTNPMTQVRWMVKYVNGPRYGSACKAWAFWRVHHWY